MDPAFAKKAKRSSRAPTPKGGILLRSAQHRTPDPDPESEHSPIPGVDRELELSEEVTTELKVGTDARNRNRVPSRPLAGLSPCINHQKNLGYSRLVFPPTSQEYY